MSNHVEIVSGPPLWRQPTGDSFEHAKARFLSHENDEAVDLEKDMDGSDESPF